MKTHLELKHLVTTSFAAFAAVLFLGCGAQQSADSGSFEPSRLKYHPLFDRCCSFISSANRRQRRSRSLYF